MDTREISLHQEFINGLQAISILETLIATKPEYEEHYVRLSEMLDDCSYEEIERLDAEYTSEYKRLVREITDVWGKPTYEADWADPAFPEWAFYVEMAYWLKGDYLAFAAFSHQDKELPMEVILGVHINVIE